MADLVDKIVIVCAYKKTPMELVQNSKAALKNFEGKIAGVILNGVPFKGNHYYTKSYGVD